jgi:FKBP-type peptidyl-prolyl cis-trans isomerase
VIPGWTEGLQKINQGGKIRLYIPPQLAYGDAGQQGIPPGSTLIFDIELLDVKATPPAAPVEPKK